MDRDTVARWEAWPVGALVAAAGLNTALWYAGAAMPDAVRWLLPWLITAAAVASVIAIDGSLVATIAGMRAGRRSKWSVVNIIVTAAFTGLAALAAHTLPTIGPWLHGLFALTIVSYAMHLAQPKATTVNAHLDSLQAELAQTRARLTQVLAELDSRPVLVDTPQPRLTAPVDSRPDILRWRDDDGLTFDAIGERLSISRQAAQARYATAAKKFAREDV